jgi:hypothetical protein
MIAAHGGDGERLSLREGQLPGARAAKGASRGAALGLEVLEADPGADD